MTAPDRDRVTLTLPVPPSGNRMWRHYGKKVVLSSVVENYYVAVRVAGLQARLKDPLEGPLRVTVRWFRGRQAGDLDNRLKVLMDSLQGVAYVSDAQVFEIHAFKDDSQPRKPRCEVKVERMSPLSES